MRALPAVLALAVLSAPLAALQESAPEWDVVELKNGSKIEGRATDYGSYVLVRTPEGAVENVSADSVKNLKIVHPFLRFPELVDFPNKTIAGGILDFRPHGDMILAFPKVSSDPRIHGVDTRTGKTEWSLDLKNRVGEPLLHGGRLIMMSFEEYIDEKKKYREGGAEHSMEIHKLTVHGFDPATGKEEWKAVYDNDDRGKLLWHYKPGSFELRPCGDRVLLITFKEGYEMKRREVDKTKRTIFHTCAIIDPARGRTVSSRDTEDLRGSMDHHVIDEMLVYSMPNRGGTWRTKGFHLNKGRMAWETELGIQRLTHADARRFYTQDPTHVWAHNLSNGKQVPKWSVEHKGAVIAGFDDTHLYVFRGVAEPKAIIGYELERGQEDFRIPYPEGDNLRFFGTFDNLLLFLDRSNALHAYDTFAKKAAWTFKGDGNAPPLHLGRADSGIVVYKDRRVYLIDPGTGGKVWEIGGDFNLVLPLSGKKILCRRLAGALLIRERSAPPGAVFLLSHDRPLASYHGVNSFSLPAMEGETLYTLGADGTLHCCSVPKQKALMQIKLSSGNARGLAGPAVRGGVVVVPRTAAVVGVNPETGENIWEERHFVTDPLVPFVLGEKGAILTQNTGLVCVDLAAGKQVWKTDISRINGVVPHGKHVTVLADRQVLRVGTLDGGVLWSHPLPAVASSIVADEDAVYAVSNGMRIGRYVPGERGFEWTHDAADKTAQPQAGLSGNAAAGDGRVFFTSLDKEVVCLEKKHGKKMWARPAPELTSRLLFHDGRLWYVDLARGAVALDAATGEPAWQLDLDRPGDFTPVILEGGVRFWSLEGWMIRPD